MKKRVSIIAATVVLSLLALAASSNVVPVLSGAPPICPPEICPTAN